jgi:hypothetical protein
MPERKADKIEMHWGQSHIEIVLREVYNIEMVEFLRGRPLSKNKKKTESASSLTRFASAANIWTSKRICFDYKFVVQKNCITCYNGAQKSQYAEGKKKAEKLRYKILGFYDIERLRIGDPNSEF